MYCSISQASPPSRFLKSQIQRALRFLHRPDRDAVGINHGSLQAAVPEQSLDYTDIRDDVFV